MHAGVRPVEQMVDAAIERIEREQGLSRQVDHERELDRERGLVQHGIVRANAHAMPTRLRWKGLDVSEEFRQYAERVANGEDLPPFEGRVLAEPNPAFPWGVPPPPPAAASTSKGSRLALLSSAAFALGLLAWAFIPRGAADAGALLQPVPPAASEPAASVEPAAGEVAAADAVGSPELSAAPEAPATEVVTAALLPPPVDSSSVDAVSMHSSVAPPASEVAPSPTPELTATPVAPAAKPAPRAPEKAAAPVASAPAAAAKSVAEDEFGIMQLDEPRAGAASSGSTPSVSAAKTATPARASVGDLARAGQGPAGAVRKEPGSESSAKGSLLVETPSF